MVTTTPAQYLLILIDLAEEQGLSREALLAGTSLSGGGLDDIGARVSDADFNAVAANALDLTGDPALGLKMGPRLNLSAHATLGQAFLTCRDLAGVMELFMAYYHVLAPHLELEFSREGEHCALTVVHVPEDSRAEFSYELLFGAIVNTLRGLLDMPELAVDLETPYPMPVHGHQYQGLFGGRVQFGCVQGRLLFPAQLLEAPLPASNPALRALYERECARLLTDLSEADSVAEQTLRLLRKLEGQYPQMPQLAEMLNLSARTYRRRLQQENQSYQTLLDQVRAEHATRHLRNSRLPLTSIAYLVGFNDTSNFRRAYRKWTGHSPGEVRSATEASLRHD